MCNLQKRLIRVAFLTTPASDGHERLKTNFTAIKINQSFILTHCVKELKNSIKIRT